MISALALKNSWCFMNSEDQDEKTIANEDDEGIDFSDIPELTAKDFERMRPWKDRKKQE